MNNVAINFYPIGSDCVEGVEQIVTDSYDVRDLKGLLLYLLVVVYGHDFRQIIKQYTYIHCIL